MCMAQKMPHANSAANANAKPGLRVFCNATLLPRGVMNRSAVIGPTNAGHVTVSGMWSMCLAQPLGSMRCIHKLLSPLSFVVVVFVLVRVVVVCLVVVSGGIDVVSVVVNVVVIRCCCRCN